MSFCQRSSYRRALTSLHVDFAPMCTSPLSSSERNFFSEVVVITFPRVGIQSAIKEAEDRKKV